MAKQPEQKPLPMDEAEGPRNLQDYVTDSKRWDNINDAKLAVMRDVSYAKKTTPEAGSGLNYSYLSEGDLLSVVRPAMVKHGLTMRPIALQQIASDSWNAKSGSIQHRVRFAVTYELKCTTTKGTETEQITVSGEGADTSDKASGKAMTNAEKYALRQAFLIESGLDTDKYASQEVTSLASSMDKEKEEAFQRFQGAVAMAETTTTLDKLRNTYLTRGFDDKHLASLEETYSRTAAKLATAKKE